MQDEQGQGGWLPPEHAGEGPPRPAQAPPQEAPPPQHQVPPPQQQPPPPQQTPPGWQQPPPGWYPPQQPPPGYWWPQQPWQQPQDTGPGNSSAIAAFVLALSGLGLLLVTFGLLSPASIVCGALAIWFGVKGRRAVDSGETSKHRGLAQAGFVIGIATVILSVLAIVGWVLLFTLDEDFLDELDEDRQFDEDFDSIRAMAVAARVALWLLS
jgi:hypothetical protein